MKQKVPRIIKIYKNYFWDFYNAQTQKTQKKIDWVIDVVKTLEIIPQNYFDSIGDGIFEIRIEFQSNIFRVFCCFDEGNLVILMNGFQKKSPKTPKTEIEKAKSIMEEYFEEKSIKKLKK
jgi:phage-related protein